MIRKIYILLLISILLINQSSAVSITFVDPTPANSSTDYDGNISVNTSVFVENNGSATLNWNNSLVGWWRMNENTGSAVQDHSGYGYNGTLENETTWNSSGKMGPGLTFDGDDWANVSNMSTTTFGTGSITFMAWIYPTAFGASDFIFTVGKVGDNPFATLELSATNRVGARVEGSTSDQVTLTDDGQQLVANNWYHVAVVYDRTNNLAKRYVNGLNTGTNANIASITGTVDTLGIAYIAAADNQLSTSHFTGVMDDLQVYNRALSNNEINASYNASQYNLNASFSGLATGDYWSQAFVQNSTGTVNQTETRVVTVATPAPTYVPDTPQNLSNTTGINHINFTWESGHGGYDLKFAWVTDIQYENTDTYFGDSILKLNDFISVVNTSFDTDFVIQTGDFINSNSTSKALTISELNAIEDSYNNSIIPRYYVLGNHDVERTSRQDMYNNTGMTASNYSFDIGDYRFIVLDTFWYNDSTPVSENPIENSYLPQSQFDWLNSTLITSKKVIVFTHYKIYDSDTDNYLAIMDALENAGNVIAVLNGHIHTNYNGTANGVRYITQDDMVGDLYPETAYSFVYLNGTNIHVVPSGRAWGYNASTLTLPNITDSYNLSYDNGASWLNHTLATYQNFSYLDPGEWINVSVYAFNESGTGTLNQTPISMNAQATAVTNSVPNISFIAPTLANGSTNTTGTISINTTVSDADGDNMTALLNWNRSLVGWWRMNEVSGGTLVQDFSGYGNNGTWSGNTTSNVTSGQFGNALAFDGVDDYVDAGNGASLDITNTITIEAWVKTSYSGTYNPIVTKDKSNAWSIYRIVIINGKIASHMGQQGVSGDNELLGNSLVNDGGWHHIAWSYDMQYVRIFKDGSLDSTPVSRNWFMATDTTGLTFGSFNGYPGNVFGNGTIDEVRIYNRALSAEEINASYNAGLYRLNTTISGLADGIYNYTAYVQDAYGSVVATEMRYVTVDLPYIPPSPISLANTTGNFWVNHTWSAGSGNVTNSYNIYQNETWTNGTTNLSFNVSVGINGWSNISVYSFNSSGTGTLNITPATMNTQAPTSNTILHYDFESADSLNTSAIYGANEWVRTNGCAYNQDYSWKTANCTWNYNNSRYYWLGFNQTVDTGRIVTLTWYGNLSAEDQYDGGRLEYYNGTGWQTALNVTPYYNQLSGWDRCHNPSLPEGDQNNTPCWSGTGLHNGLNVSVWQIYTANLTSVVNQITGFLGIRWTFGSDASVGSSGWNIDNVTLFYGDDPGGYINPILTPNNTKTNNGTLSLSVNSTEAVTFSVTSNINIDYWNWTLNNYPISNVTDTHQQSFYTDYDLPILGLNTITAFGTNNTNGSSNMITWTVNVTQIDDPETNVTGSVLNLTKIGQMPWGISMDSATNGSYVFTDEGKVLTAYTYADPVNPVLVGSIILNKDVYSIAADSTHIYAGTSGAIYIINYSAGVENMVLENTIIPENHGSWHIPLYFHPQDSMTIDGDYLHVGAQIYGFVTYNVSNKSNPTEYAYIGNDAYDFDIVGDRLYLGGNDNNVEIINRTTMAIISNWSESAESCRGEVHGIVVNGSDMYTTNYGWGYYSVNISDELNPVTQSKTIKPSCGEDAWDMERLNDTFLVSSSNYQGLSLINISDPYNIQRIELPSTISNPSIDANGYGRGISVSPDGNTIFMSVQYKGLTIFNHSRIRSAITPHYGKVFTLRTSGDYTLTYMDGFESSFNESNLGNITLSNQTSKIGRPADSVIVGDYMYSNGGNLYIYNISNPATPFLANSVSSYYYDNNMFYANGYLHTADYFDYVILNISNPESPVIVGRHDIPDVITTSLARAGFVTDGNYTYLNYNDTFTVLNVTNVSNIIIMAQIPIDPPMQYSYSAMYLNSSLNRVYAKTGYSNVSIINITNKSAPEILYEIGDGLNYGIKTITQSRNYLFVSKADSLQIYNLTTEPPVLEATYSNISGSMYLDPITEYLYTFHDYDYSGYEVYSIYDTETEEPTVPTISFILPTLANNSINTTGSISINTTTTNASNGSIILNLNNSLVGWWRMNETSGTVVNDFDSTTNLTMYSMNTGLDNGSSGHNSTRCKFGSCMAFDGVGYVRDTLDSSDMKITGAISLGGWFNFTNLNPNRYMISRGKGLATSGNHGYALSISANTLYFDRYSAAGTRSTVSHPGFVVNKQYYIVATWDGTTDTNGIKIYVNGTLVKQGTSLITSMGTPLGYNMTFGARQVANNTPSTDDRFTGTMDDVFVVDRAISAAEVLAMYNSNNGLNTVSGISNGSYNFKAYVQDSNGTLNQTESRYLTIDLSAQQQLFVPPDPVLYDVISSYNGQYINTSWINGTGNTTNSYNVSVVGVGWVNGSITSFYNHTGRSEGLWSNVSVWAYNNSGTGSLSSGYFSLNTQIVRLYPIYPKQVCATKSDNNINWSWI